MKAGLILIAVVVAILGSMLTLLVVLTPDSNLSGCGSATPEDSIRVTEGGDRLDAAQRANAARVITEGRRRNLPNQALVIALAVASQESGFRNYANDGEGGDLTAGQLGIEQSLSYPHEAVGTDHGSLGVFQQQWPWWGSMAELMDPTEAAGKFYAALMRVPRWASLPVTVAAQRVQRSAYPSAYADDEPLARHLLRGSSPAQVQSAAFTADPASVCTTEPVGGVVQAPLPKGSGYVDLRNWGRRASVWARGHTGTDFSARCGTPVLAATSGTVMLRTDQSWAGRWLVEVSTGAKRLTTWYAHMQTVLVSAGQRVTAGQQIGEVGNLGNSTGCHLHFEVHPDGGTIYQDNVNPTVWLARHVGRSLSPSGTGFVVATFNALGASHTAAGGNKPWMASGVRRTGGMVQLLADHHVDVAGLQEFQSSQYRTFKRLAGTTYAVWHPPGDTENAIMWRRERWSFVGARSFVIPYFDGRRRRMPVVRLAERGTGRMITFVNVHNPADTRRFPRQGRWRAAALAAELRVVLAERRGGKVVIIGDFNERRAPLCWLAHRAGLYSADGGRPGAGCQPRRRSSIDWILASPDLFLVGHEVDRSDLVRATTDHALVLATLR